MSNIPLKEEEKELSATEIRVFQLISNGRKVEDIAREVRITKRSVESSIYRGMKKLKVEFQAHAVALLLRQGIIK